MNQTAWGSQIAQMTQMPQLLRVATKDCNGTSPDNHALGTASGSFSLECSTGVPFTKHSRLVASGGLRIEEQLCSLCSLCHP